MITIFEFDKYKHANNTLQKIEEEMEVPVCNKVAEKMITNKRSRR
ncbi:MAG: hypothetical protein QNK78_06195 [Crocinitomicaceae bacterium]|nr:hypothetical protein [Crocinitomicaceae bacterium]